MRAKLHLIALGCGLLSVLPGNASACEVATVRSPSANETVSDSRPSIEWVPVSGAEVYRVQLQSRVPGGHVVARVDTQVRGTRFVPAQPLADTRSVVWLRISARCAPGTPDELREYTRFYIDTSPRCVLANTVAIETAPGRLELQWPVLANARAYETSLFSPEDGRLLSRQEVQGDHITFGGLHEGAVVIAVRPRCANGYGAGRYRMAWVPP
jgi:hypothetical protein